MVSCPLNLLFFLPIWLPETRNMVQMGKNYPLTQNKSEIRCSSCMHRMHVALCRLQKWMKSYMYPELYPSKRESDRQMKEGKNASKAGCNIL